MELERLLAHLMTIVALAPFITIGVSKFTENRRSKNLYNNR